MSKHQSSNKQSSNLTKDTSNSAISVATVGDFVEMTSIATSPLHVDEKSDRSTESTVRTDERFFSSLYKALSLQALLFYLLRVNSHGCFRLACILYKKTHGF